MFFQVCCVILQTRTLVILAPSLILAGWDICSLVSASSEGGGGGEIGAAFSL